MQCARTTGKQTTECKHRCHPDDHNAVREQGAWEDATSTLRVLPIHESVAQLVIASSMPHPRPSREWPLGSFLLSPCIVLNPICFLAWSCCSVPRRFALETITRRPPPRIARIPSKWWLQRAAPQGKAALLVPVNPSSSPMQDNTGATLSLCAGLPSIDSRQP